MILLLERAEENPMSNEDASSVHYNLQDQLRAAAAGGDGGERISRTASLFGGRFALTMGTLIAVYFLVVAYLYPLHNGWLSLAVTAVFVVSMVGTVRRHEARRRASSIGWSRRYSLAFAISVGLFGAGMVLLDVIESRDWWIWLPWAVLTALPLATPRFWPGAK
jgi:hypothetical protein